MNLKRTISIILSLALVFTTITKSPTEVQAATIINIGDYVYFGEYNGEPILWRVINLDENGDPLLWSEYIISYKPFDGAESGAYYETGGSYSNNEYRQKWGSNHWHNSNLREWLNSNSHTVAYTTQPPTESAVYEGYNAYANEAGFLTNFTQEEQEVIKPVTHKTLLTELDKSYADGGSELHNWEGGYPSVGVTNYNYAYNEWVTDQVFLLSIKEVADYIEARGYKWHKETTLEAHNRDESGWGAEPGNYDFYCLRSPYSGDSSRVRYVNRDGYVNIHGASSATIGVAPALYINLDYVIFTSGLGTKSSPYAAVGADNNGKTPLGYNYNTIDEKASLPEIVNQVDDDLKEIRDFKKIDSDSLEEITNYTEYAIRQASTVDANVVDDAVTIMNTLVDTSSNKANELKSELEDVIVDNEIELNRTIQTEIKVKAEMVSDILDVNLDPSIVDASVDKITIETGKVNITIEPDKIQEDLDETLTVKIEKVDKNTTAKIMDSLEDIPLNTYNNGIYQLMEDKTLTTGYIDDTGEFKISFEKGNEIIDKTETKLTIGLEVIKGEVDYNCIFLEKENGTTEALGGNVNKKTDKVEIRTNESGIYYITENRKSFNDITNLDKETKQAIEILAAKGMINGKGESIFDPNGTISRAEFTKIIIRALYLYDSSAPNTFTDVVDTSWYAGYVASSKKAGLINGYTDGTFKPVNIITKQEVVKICSASLHEQKGYIYPTNKSLYLSNYTDNVASWVKQYLALAEREGIIVNSSTGIFNGSKGTTRADAAVMVYRLFKRL